MTIDYSKIKPGDVVGARVMTDLQSATDDELRAAIAKGARQLLALEMGELADMRVASAYPDYGSDAVLDRNFQQTQRLRAALFRARAELASRSVAQ